MKTTTLSAMVAIVMLACGLSAQDCVPPAAGLVSWWRAEGDVSDAVGGNHGTFSGNTAYDTGKVGLGFAFDGNGDMMVVGTPASLQLQDLTIEAWIKRTSASVVTYNGGGGIIFGSTSGGYIFYLGTDNRLHFGKAGTVAPGSAGTITDTAWHHVAATKSGNTMRLYLDGVLDSTSGLAVTFSFSMPMAIGAEGDTSNSSFLGMIDELSVFNRELTSTEIQAAYNAGTAGKCASPFPPSFVTQPTNLTVTAGEYAAFTVLAAGSAPLTYQWVFNGSEPLANSNTNTLWLTNVEAGAAGTYSVILSNALGITNSSEAFLTVNPAPPCTPPPAGLISWWRAQGNALDELGGNPGTLLNQATYAPGRSGPAFVFDGSGDVVTLGNSTNLQVQDLTVEGWVKRASASTVSFGSGNTGVLFGYGDGGYSFWIGGSGALYLGKLGTIAVSSSAAITDTDFHHVAVTKSGVTLTFYVDGVPTAGPDFNQTFQFLTSVAIGARPDNNNDNSFYGKIDELAVYNRGLSGAEIQAIYDAGVAGKCATESPPYVFTHPTNKTAYAGATVAFNAQVGGTPPLSFQWRLNQADIGGATNATLALTNLGTSQVGAYDLVATNNYGSVTSAVANLAVLPVVVSSNLFDDFEPGIDAAQWAGFGGTVLATNYGGFISASNSLWFGGTGTRQATTRPLVTTNGATIQFWLRLARGSSSVWETADLPTKGVVLEYTNSASGGWMEMGRYTTSNHTNWTAVTVATPIAIQGYPTQFRWRQFANSGANFDHWALDDVVLLTAPTPPGFLTQPQNQTVVPGGTATFSATVAGSPALIYQWRSNSVSLPGATNATLILSNVQPSQAASYSLAVTNALGFAVSANATLKVIVLTAYADGQPLTNALHAFSGPITISITNVYPGGLVFYTLDGSSPSFLSAQYTGPFQLSQSATLRAIGYRVDFAQSGQLEPIALQIAPPFVLSASTPGGGTIGLNPAGGSYVSNTVVQLTATPNAGWVFLKWLGDASGTDANNSVTMTRDKSVQALFGTTLSTTAAGGGSVTLNPPGGVYPYGFVVQLSAIPTPGNFFGIWGNAASGNINPLHFTVTNANPTISSLFAPVSDGQVALTVVPVGRGSININPPANAYPTGASVTLTALPEPGQSFLGWSGDATANQSPLLLPLNADKLIIANFTRQPRLTVATTSGAWRSEGLQLTISGDAGEIYQLEVSTNLTSWATQSLVTNSFGTYEFTDPNTGAASRYYRCLLLP